MALLVPDDLWQAIEPLLPPGRAKPKGGRPRAPDRSALAGMRLGNRTSNALEQTNRSALTQQ